MKNKTIAQQLKIKDFPFTIKDKNNNCLYLEFSNGLWEKFDENNNRIYYQNSNGYWQKNQYDENGHMIYMENSNGEIIDNRPKPILELTLEQIAEKFNTKVENIKIKK
jgi:hypothetical protein